MSKLILHNYFRSSASYRVRVALKLKNLDYDYHAVHLLKDNGQQFRPEYKKINPSAQVPTLIDGDFNLGQSMAILDYLDQKWPQPLLFPKDIKSRALVWQICEIINSGIQPLQNVSVMLYLEKNLGADSAERQQWLTHWISNGLKSLEQMLSQTAGQFSVGDIVSAADCCLIPQVVSSERFKVDVSGYDTIMRVFNNCMKLSAFSDSHPSVQPDAE